MNRKKLNEAMVVDILAMIGEGRIQKNIAAIFDVHVTTINRIRCGKIWKKVQRPPIVMLRAGRLSPCAHAIPEEIVKKIQADLANKKKQLYLAALYGVSQSTISEIARRAIRAS